MQISNNIIITKILIIVVSATSCSLTIHKLTKG